MEWNQNCVIFGILMQGETVIFKQDQEQNGKFISQSINYC